MQQEIYDKYLEVRELAENKNWKEVYKLVKILVEKDPDNRLVLFEYARCLNQLSFFEEAEKIFKKLIDTKSRPFALLELGKIYRKQLRYQEAIECFEGLSNTHLCNVGHLELIRCYTRTSKYTKAKAESNQLIGTKYYNGALNELGICELALLNYEEAALYFKSILGSSYNDSALYNLAVISENSGDFNKALEYLDKLENENYILMGNTVRSRILISEGKYDEALLLLKKTPDYEKKTFVTSQIAFIKYLQNDFEGAEKVCFRAGNNPYDVLNRIYILLHIGKYEEAFSEYSKLQESFEGKYITYDILRALERLNIVLKYKCGRLSEYSIEKHINEDSYFFNQLICYNEKDVINHVKKHLSEADKKIHTKFVDGLDVNQLFTDCVKAVEKTKPISINYSDKYILDMGYQVSDDNGVANSKVIVITLPGEKRIISIYPIQNFIEKKVEVRKVLSGLDRFNRRYKNN